MNWFITRAYLALFICCAGPIACNSSSTIQAGGALGKAGSSWATSAATTVSTVATDLNTSVDGRIITSALTGLPGPDDAQLGDIQRVIDACVARAELLQSLASAYQSLNNLSAYDASTEVESSLTNLDGSINNLSKILGSDKPPLSNVTQTITGIAASAIVSDVQAAKIKKASSLLEERLKAFQSLYDKDKATIESVQKQIIIDQTNTVQALFNAGIGDPAPILSAQFQNSGLNYVDEQALAAIKADPDKLKKAIQSVVSRNASQRISLHVQILESIHTGVGTLIAQHERLAAGQSLDLQTISLTLSQLNTYVGQLLSAYNKDHPAKTTK